MFETLIASSALIAGVCGLRLLFKGKISPMVQYAMWGIPALRLLLPLVYPAQRWLKTLKSSYSVMNAVDQLQQKVVAGTRMEPLMDNLMTGRVRGYVNPETLAEKLAGVDWQMVILVVWLAGSVGLLVWILWVNFRFAARLRRERVPFEGDTCGATHLPVYVAPGLKSPCLVMFLGEQVIYLPDQLPGGTAQLRHILTHETCHARHHDPLWGALRCMLVCAYWINPLVWVAAALSKRDCELACDEAAVKRLGEDDRFEYGRTLIALTARKREASDVFCISSDFVYGRRTMRERIKLLAAHPRMTALSAVLVLTAAAALITCTYTGKTAEGVQRRTQQWAREFCRRDGRALADLFNPDRMDDFYEMEPVMLDENGEYMGFGWSSPWPMDNQYDIAVDGTGAEITYYAMTSDPHRWVWKEQLYWVERGGEYYVDREVFTAYDTVATAGAFEAAYRQGIAGTQMDYRSNGMGEALNDKVKRDPVMQFLFDPVKAGEYLLNLSGGTGEISAEGKENGGQASVSYRFSDGSSVLIAMERPFGADGIWVPTGWSLGETAGESGDLPVIYREGDLELRALRFDEKQQMYQGILVKNGDVSAAFPDWRQLNLWPEDYPAVSRFGDGYLLIRLIQGEGTGALESGAHVLAEADLREIALEDPVSYAAAHITGTRENGQIELFQDGRLAGVYKLQGDENLAALYDELSFGAVTEYGLQGGEPCAALSVTASPSLTVGTLRLSYALEDGSFRVAHASVETPESEAVTAVVRQFAEAYFRNDPKGMAAVMTGPAVKKIAGAGEELCDRLDAFQIKGDLADAANQDRLEVQCEYRVEGEDSYTYLGVELTRGEKGWAVTGYYLEK